MIDNTKTTIPTIPTTDAMESTAPTTMAQNEGVAQWTIDETFSLAEYDPTKWELEPAPEWDNSDTAATIAASLPTYTSIDPITGAITIIVLGPKEHDNHHTYFSFSEDGQVHYRHFPDDPLDTDTMLTMVSHIIAHGDANRMVIKDIVAQGHELRYAGWQSNMLFEYIDVASGEVCWSRHFPQWIVGVGGA